MCVGVELCQWPSGRAHGLGGWEQYDGLERGEKGKMKMKMEKQTKGVQSESRARGVGKVEGKDHPTTHLPEVPYLVIFFLHPSTLLGEGNQTLHVACIISVLELDLFKTSDAHLAC